MSFSWHRHGLGSSKYESQLCVSFSLLAFFAPAAFEYVTRTFLSTLYHCDNQLESAQLTPHSIPPHIFSSSSSTSSFPLLSFSFLQFSWAVYFYVHQKFFVKDYYRVRILKLSFHIYIFFQPNWHLWLFTFICHLLSCQLSQNT